MLVNIPAPWSIYGNVFYTGVSWNSGTPGHHPLIAGTFHEPSSHWAIGGCPGLRNPPNVGMRATIHWRNRQIHECAWAAKPILTHFSPFEDIIVATCSGPSFGGSTLHFLGNIYQFSNVSVQTYLIHGSTICPKDQKIANLRYLLQVSKRISPVVSFRSSTKHDFRFNQNTPSSLVGDLHDFHLCSCAFPPGFSFQ